MRGNPTLFGSARMWGTPVARDDQKSPEAHRATKDRMGGGPKELTSLTVQVKDWPTPKARDMRGGSGTPAEHRRHAPDLPTVAAGHRAGATMTDGSTTSPNADLNPRFVEALMGVPAGWADPLVSLTPSTCSETGSYQRWLRLHSLSLPTASTWTSGPGEVS